MPVICAVFGGDLGRNGQSGRVGEMLCLMIRMTAYEVPSSWRASLAPRMDPLEWKAAPSNRMGCTDVLIGRGRECDVMVLVVQGDDIKCLPLLLRQWWRAQHL